MTHYIKPSRIPQNYLHMLLQKLRNILHIISPPFPMFLPSVGASGGLSMRHGPGHPHSRDGLHWRGGAARRAGEERRGAGADGAERGHRPGDLERDDSWVK